MPLPANPKETGPSKTADEWLSRREPADELESLAADAVKRFRSLVNQNDGVLCSIVCDTLYDAACRRGDGGRDRMPPTVGFLEDKVRILKAENVRLRIVEKEAAEACAKLVAYRALAKEHIARLRSMGLALLEEWRLAKHYRFDTIGRNRFIEEEYEALKAAWLGQPEVTDVPR